MAARGGPLNPTSLPFFPGGSSHGSESGDLPVGLGFRLPRNSEIERSSSSTLLASSDYRSVNSSPSPPGGNPEMHVSLLSKGRPTAFGEAIEALDDDVDEPVISSRHVDEMVSERLHEIFADGEETPGPLGSQWIDGSKHNANHLSLSDPLSGVSRSTSTSPFILPRTESPYSINVKNARIPSFGFKSLSPVSSASSGALHGPNPELPPSNFEVQLKTSPFIMELLGRLSHYEHRHTDIQRELTELHRKINLLLDRSLGLVGSEPEFKNPFTQQNLNGDQFSSSGMLTPVSALSPLQSTTSKSDELNQLSERLDSLTVSVGQMLAFQGQQHSSNPPVGLSQSRNNFPSRQGSFDIAPNQVVTPPVTQTAIANHSFPVRPDYRSATRASTMPMRTWSAGNIEVPARLLDPNNIRQDNLSRDKRRSVANINRRDSTGVSYSLFDDKFSKLFVDYGIR